MGNDVSQHQSVAQKEWRQVEWAQIGVLWKMGTCRSFASFHGGNTCFVYPGIFLCCSYLQISAYALLFHLSMLHVLIVPIVRFGLPQHDFNLCMSSTQHKMIWIVFVRLSRTDPEQVLQARKVRGPWRCFTGGGVKGGGRRNLFTEALDVLQKPRMGKEVQLPTMTKENRKKKEKEGRKTQPSKSGPCFREVQAGGEVTFGVHVIKLGGPHLHLFDLVTVFRLFLDFILLLIIQPLFNHLLIFFCSSLFHLEYCISANSENFL